MNQPEARTASETTELLLHEFMHRLNNDLAAMIAILAREGNDNSAVERCHSRLSSLGRLYQVLAPPRHDAIVDAADYLDRLCHMIQVTTLSDVQLDFTGGYCPLDARRCWRLGLIVAELIANARRHAFAGSHGRVCIELTAEPEFIRCRVADDGIGFKCSHPGLGLSIIDALVNSLAGHIARHAGQGTSWLLTIPRWQR